MSPARLHPLPANPAPLTEGDILARIADLYVQATTEHSHFYTAKTLELAYAEIVRLRELVATLEGGKP
jgi:hypothetical protein